VPAFQLAIAVRIVGTGLHVHQVGLADEFFEVLGEGLGAIITDNPRVACP
jgi:hypothetical protein